MRASSRVALIAWLGRDGYADSADDELSFLDAIYYATVSVTTTGGNAARAEEAAEHGYAAIEGDASSASVLRRAHVQDARAAVVAPDRDDTAVLITLTARELNPTATIVVSVREEENAHLLRQSGADSVITSSGAAGRLLGLATLEPAAVQVLEDVVVAVVRDEEVLRFDDERAQTTQAGDRLVCLCAHGGKDPHER